MYVCKQEHNANGHKDNQYCNRSPYIFACIVHLKQDNLAYKNVNTWLIKFNTDPKVYLNPKLYYDSENKARVHLPLKNQQQGSQTP